MAAETIEEIRGANTPKVEIDAEFVRPHLAANDIEFDDDDDAEALAIKLFNFYKGEYPEADALMACEDCQCLAPATVSVCPYCGTLYGTATEGQVYTRVEDGARAEVVEVGEEDVTVIIEDEQVVLKQFELLDVRTFSPPKDEEPAAEEKAPPKKKAPAKGKKAPPKKKAPAKGKKAPPKKKAPAKAKPSVPAKRNVEDIAANEEPLPSDEDLESAPLETVEGYIKARRAAAAENVYDLGVLLRSILRSEKYKDAGVKSFGAYLSSVWKISRQTAHTWIQVVDTFGKEEAIKLGVSKAYVIATAAPEDQDKLKDKAKGGASTRDLADEAKKGKEADARKKKSREPHTFTLKDCVDLGTLAPTTEHNLTANGQRKATENAKSYCRQFYLEAGVGIRVNVAKGEIDSIEFLSLEAPSTK